MVNYKGQIRSILVAGYEKSIPAQAKIVTLHEVAAADTGADGMIDDADGLIYQVTAGKTFHCLGVMTDTDGNSGSMVVSSGDTENAETATVATIYTWSSTAEEWHIRDFTIASAKFITHNPSGTQVTYVKMIGYEV